MNARAVTALAATLLLACAAPARANDAGVDTQALHADGSVAATGELAGLWVTSPDGTAPTTLDFRLDAANLHVELDHSDVGVHAGAGGAAAPASTASSDIAGAIVTGGVARAGYALDLAPLPGNVRPIATVTGGCLEAAATQRSVESHSSRVSGDRSPMQFDLQSAVAVRPCGALHLKVTGEVRASFWEIDATLSAGSGPDRSDLQTGRLAQPGAAAQLQPAVTRDQQAYVDAVQATFEVDLPATATVLLEQAFVQADHLRLDGARGVLPSAHGDLQVQGTLDVRGDPAGARLAGHGPNPFSVRIFAWREADVGGVEATPAAAATAPQAAAAPGPAALWALGALAGAAALARGNRRGNRGA